MTSDAEYREIFDATNDAIFIHDAETGAVLEVNQAMLRMYGFESKEEYISNAAATLSNEPGYGMDEAQRRMRLAIEEGPQVFDWPARRKNGEHFWVEVSLRSSTVAARRRVLAVVRDITERRLTQDAFLHFYDQPVGLHIVADAAGVILRASRGWTDMLGYPREAIEGRVLLDLIHPDDHESTLAAIARVGRGLPLSGFENRYRHRDGSYRVIRWTGNYSKESRQVFALGLDVTEEKLATQELKTSLREKDALLKEVHHRVKNNLQVISSLLRLETNRARNGAARAVLSDMQGRIRSMALLHQALYRSGTFSHVDLAGYLKEVAEHLLRAHASGPARVSLRLDLAPSPVDIDLAVPCGLIVNELITNSLRHAFEAGSTGVISLQLRRAGEAQLQLAVSDTGRGLPPDFEARREQSLGLQLVSDLVRQISGTMSVDSSAGVSFAIDFRTDVTAAGARILAAT